MESPSPLDFCVDQPCEIQEFAFGEVLVHGWALSNEGRLSITARVGDLPWTEIGHGKSRNDVGQAFPNVPNAAQSGFSGRIDIHMLAPGEYPFRLRVTTPSGAEQEMIRRVLIAPTPEHADQVTAVTEDDTVRLKLEEPSERTLVLRNSVLRVGGWATSKKGVQRVDVWLDGSGPHTAHYGLMRDDVGAVYDDFPKSSHAGYLWAWKIDQLQPGPHQLRIRCTSIGGAIAELTAPFEVQNETEYDIWTRLVAVAPERLLEMSEESKSLLYRPKISIVTPVFRTPMPFLRKCVQSVQRQVYPNWELILVDDGSKDSELTAALDRFRAEDRRVKVLKCEKNGGIAAASNAGLQLCTGEFVGLLDHDDEIAPDACLRIAEALNQDRTLDTFYSDEDKINEEDTHQDAFFKPDWSPHLLLSMNYVCHFLVCRRTVLQAIGGFRLGYDGSQDYDLILRISEHTERIRRIPKVLYHWRIHSLSTAAGMDVKPSASDAGRRALQDHLDRRGGKGKVLEIGPGRYRVKYEVEGSPEVAIIIPTGGSPTLEAALRSVLDTTTYPNFRIIVVDNSRGDRVVSTLSAFRSSRRPIDLIDCRGLRFNFSLLCNRAAASTAADYLLFLNDDTSIITPDWIETMLEQAQQPRTGAVGALLLFPNGGIQHAGVATGLFGVAGHPFRGFEERPYYFDFTHVIRNCAAVTGACLMIRHDLFDAVGGFDEPNLPTCFQDVDICLKMLERGHHVVYTPFAKLFHYESFSKKAISDIPEIEFMKERWSGYLNEDPFYNPNLATATDDYSLKYDQIFLPSQNCETHALAKDAVGCGCSSPVRTPIAKRISKLDKIRFFATREALGADGKSVRLTFSWATRGLDKVNIRFWSPMGPVLTDGDPTGAYTTSQWIEKGTIFYLLDASDDRRGSPEHVLSALRV